MWLTRKAGGRIIPEKDDFQIWQVCVMVVDHIETGWIMRSVRSGIGVCQCDATTVAVQLYIPTYIPTNILLPWSLCFAFHFVTLLADIIHNLDIQSYRQGGTQTKPRMLSPQTAKQRTGPPS